MENGRIYIGPKTMEYNREKAKDGKSYDILFQAKHILGYKAVIVNYYSHPCAYIGLPEDHPYCNKDYGDLNIDCHGGLTYSDNKHTMVKELCSNGWFIGWDYAHSGDYLSYSPESYDKMWTTEEIMEECANVIEQLEEVKQKALEG